MGEGTMTAFSTATTDRQASAEPLVLRRDRDGVATLTLNRPEARNALSSALMSEMHDLLDQIADDGQVKVVVIAGAGPAFRSEEHTPELQSLMRISSAGFCLKKKNTPELTNIHI